MRLLFRIATSCALLTLIVIANSALAKPTGRALPGMVSLAGADKDAMVKTMLDFKSGSRPATLMHQLAKGYSDAEIIAIAGYFAAQKK